MLAATILNAPLAASLAATILNAALIFVDWRVTWSNVKAKLFVLKNKCLPFKIQQTRARGLSTVDTSDPYCDVKVI